MHECKPTGVQQLEESGGEVKRKERTLKLLYFPHVCLLVPADMLQLQRRKKNSQLVILRHH